MTANAWTLSRPAQPPRTMLDLFLAQNRFTLRQDDDAFTHLKMNGGKFRLPMERRADFFAMCAADVRSGNFNFVVEMPFAPNIDHDDETSAAAMRLVMDLDVDSPDGETPDAEWHCLLAGILGVIDEVYAPTLSAYERRVVVLNAGTKQRRKDGRDVVKTGRHCVFPQIYVTRRTALRLREMIIHRLAQRQTLEQCPHLRAEPIESIIDKCIYENGASGKMNGMRMTEMHKAHGCSQCKRRRNAKNRLVIERWQETAAEGAPRPPDQYWRFDECDQCFGRSFVYEGRPYSVYEVLGGDGRTLGDDLAKLKANLVALYEETCVRIADGTPPTPVAPILASVTRAADDDDNEDGDDGRRRKRRRLAIAGGGAMLDASTGAHQKAGGGGGNWSLQELRSEKALAIDRFIYEKFSHPSCHDETIDELLRTAPHGIAKWVQSTDKRVYIVTSISSLCMNKARANPREPSHSRSQVYFMVTNDGTVVQRCHADKTYCGQSCKTFRSPPSFLPVELRDMLWPPEPRPGADGLLDDVALEQIERDPSISILHVKCLLAWRVWRARNSLSKDAAFAGGFDVDVVVEDNSIDGNNGEGGGDDDDSDGEGSAGEVVVAPAAAAEPPDGEII